MAHEQHQYDDYDEPHRPTALPTGTTGYNSGSDPSAGVRLFQADTRKPTSILHVEWLNPATAEREYQQRLPPDATHEVLITACKKPGKYYLTPMSANGEPLSEPVVVNIAADNPTLVAALASVSSGVGMGFMPSNGSNEAIEILKNELAMVREREERQRAEFQIEKESLRKEREELASQRLALSVNNTSTMNELQGTLIRQHHDRAESMTTTLAVMAEKAAGRDADRHRQMLDRLDKDREAREREYAFKIKEMEALSKIRIAEEKSKSEIDRLERDSRNRAAERESKERLARERQDHDARMEREREDSKNRATEAEARYKSANKPIHKQIADWAPLLATFGLDVPGVIGKLMGAGGTQTITEIVGTTVAEGIKGYVEVRKAELQLQADAGEGGEETFTLTLPNGQQVTLTQSELNQLQAAQAAQAQAQAQATPGQPAQLPMTPPDFEQQQFDAQFGRQPTAPFAYQPLPPAVVPGKEVHTGVPSDVLDFPQQASPRDAAVAALPVATQKKARYALRELISDLEVTPEDEWSSLIMATLAETPEGAAYLRARSIYGSAIEAGASVELANKLVAFADSSGLIPADIPRR